ncbi:MAG: hypothetical protein H0V45_05275 [Actinobacteria bacterium]|nr:hypothetical protein [Actinomycetota bacterium]
MRLLRRRSAVAPLDEAAAYARCHGTRENDVRIVKLPPRRERYDVLAAGERLRRSFEERLDAREVDELASAHTGAHSGAGPFEPAPPPAVPPAA